jgi:glycerol uptake facilitator-like aquaporin
MTPDLQPDVNLIELVAYAALNPATIAVAFLMGRKADHRSKLLIAAFAGAIAGVALLYVVALLRVFDAPMLGRAAAGIFSTSLAAGLIYAAIGFVSKR